MVKELASQVLKTLEEHGFEAFFVGGCVRDWLLGRPVHDIDICTNAHPGDVIRLFPDYVPTGLKHGTVSVKLGGYMFEVTTYRTEGKYEDYRRPSEVQFVSELQLDLERRDFTINAMAMDRRDMLRDPFNGQKDLGVQRIRAVGHASTRFREDALRLLRAVRFAAQLGFTIEEDTLLAMKETAPLLCHIAVERVREELNKIMDSQSPQTGCQLLCDTALFGYSPLLGQLFSGACMEAWRLVHLGTIAQKWALLLYTAAFSAEDAREVCNSLRMSKRETESIVTLVELLHQLRPAWDSPQTVLWGPLILQAGWAVCTELDTLLQACWWKKKGEFPSRALAMTYEAMPVKSIKELAVTGLSLQIELDKKPGEWIQRVLQVLLEQTALHGLPNTPEALIEVAKKEVARDEH